MIYVLIYLFIVYFAILIKLKKNVLLWFNLILIVADTNFTINVANKQIKSLILVLFIYYYSIY